MAAPARVEDSTQGLRSRCQLLPVLIVIGAAAYYLRSVPAAGNDILLDVTLAAARATVHA